MDPTLGEMLDTSPAQRRKYFELLRALTPEQRARKAASLSQMARTLAIASILGEHPNATSQELAVRLAVRLYGADLARAVFGAVPPDAR